MVPKADGTFKVPKELVEEWSKGDQNKLLEEFRQAGLDKDTTSVFRAMFKACLSHITGNMSYYIITI